MNTQTNNKINVFGYEVDLTSNNSENIETRFIRVDDYGGESYGYLSRDSFVLYDERIKNCNHTVRYRILVSVYISRHDYKPYAEVVFIPDYRSFNYYHRAKAMKIAGNEVVRLMKDYFPAALWERGIGILLITQTEFWKYQNEIDLKENFYKGFAQIFVNIRDNMDMYFDREREEVLPSYWKELNNYCVN